MPTKVIDKSGEVRSRTRDLRCDSPDALGAATYAGDCIGRRLQRDLTQLIDGSPNEPLGAQKRNHRLSKEVPNPNFQRNDSKNITSISRPEVRRKS